MTTPNNLPAELTSFVGREPQLAELRRLVRRSRLTTLTGPGGAGKTRLALRLASETLDRYPDGVWSVDLATLSDERLVEQTVASACGISEESKRPLIEVLASGLAGGHRLLVLDGCEHVVDACAALSGALLRACPGLSILATSREPLGVTGEVIWRTPSLTTPQLEDASHPELLMESESVRLFVERARLSRPEFELDASVAAPLAQICTRLEGMPLAIELAAGLAGVMTVDEILERLSHRFRLLTGGSRSSLPRHQTLRAAVDWSYGLLSTTEQALFARLAVFAGGFDLDAAEAVVQGDPISVDQLLPLLSRLVHKSLVVAETNRPHVTRYRLLDTIREYALEKLHLVGEAEWRRRHADYFTRWSRTATRGLGSSEQVSWLQRLDEEQPNIRLALEWTLAENAEAALKLAADMGSLWRVSRSLSEGYEWLTRALDAGGSDRAARASALMARARLSRRIGDYKGARLDAEECAAIARELGLKEQLIAALTMLGIITSHEGRLEDTPQLFAEALALAEELGLRPRMASSLNNIAIGELYLGSATDALAHATKAVAISDELGDRILKAMLLDTLARINLHLGMHDVAERNYAEALMISAEFGDSINIADCLEGVALLAMSRGDPARALTLIAAAGAIRAATGAERTIPWSIEVVAAEERARAKLGAAAEPAVSKGRIMGLKDAVRYALGTRSDERRSPSQRLTAREDEVARLIASGLTNAEVAGRLRISDRTVDAHVEHIRNKLGLRSRTQIAVWANERLGGG